MAQVRIINNNTQTQQTNTIFQNTEDPQQFIQDFHQHLLATDPKTYIYGPPQCPTILTGTHTQYHLLIIK